MPRETNRKPFRTERLNLMIEPRLKRDIRGYARRHHKSVSAMVVAHFISLLEQEYALDVDQI